MPPKASASRDAEPKPKITSEQRKRMKEGKALRGEVSGKEATRPQHEETSMQSNALIDNSPMNPMAHHQVFVVRPVGTTENKGELAGYMGCENIEEFYDLCHALKDVLGSLFQHQEGGYGYTSGRTLNFADIITISEKYFVKGDIPTDIHTRWRQHIACDDLDQNYQRYGVGDNSGAYRAVVIFFRHAVVAVRKAHDLDPKFFPGPETNRPSKKIQGLFTEDINRFFVLASYIRARYRNDKKSTTGKTFLGNVGPNQRKGWSKHQPVIPSLFRYTAGPRQPNTAESEAQRHAMEVMTMMRRQAARPDLVKVKGDVGEGDVDKFDATFTSFAKPKKGGKAIRKKKGGRTQPAYRGLPAIDEKIRNAAIRALYAGLKVIYDRTEIEARTSALADDDDQETRKFATMLADLTNDKDIEGSAKKVDIEADHRAAFDESKKGADKLAEMVKLYGLSEDELLGASFEEAVKLSQDKHIARLFRLFQDSINSVSAGTLTFDEVVAQFGLDVERLADDTPVVDHHGIKLLPHQVIGIGFIFNMLRSNLRSCLLADETGLGKTIQALTADDFINADIKDALEADGFLAPEGTFVEHLPQRNAASGMFKAKKRGAADSVESDEEDYEERDDEDAHSTSSRDDSDPDTDADSSVDSDSETEARGSGGKTRKTRARVEELEDEDETSGDFAFEAYYSPESRAAMEEAIKRNEERIQEIQDVGCRYFQPTIVYAPSGSTDVWLDEITDLFPHRRLRSFLPVGSTSQKAALGTDFSGTALDLQNYVKSLPVDDPLTGDTIVVTSYTTATSRFLRHWIQLAGKKRLPLTKLTRAECIAEGIPLDQFQTQFEEAKAMRAEKAGTITYELRISAGLFGTSIWDEAHRLKNLVTQMLYTLIKMRHRRVLLLTASPFMRRLKDLTSILQVVAETSVTQLLASGSQKRVKVVEDYDDIRVLLAENGGSYLAADKQTQARLITALDPNAYEGIMNAHDDTPSIVRKVVPAPLSILALRRVTGQKVWVDGVEYTIAGNIPPFHCCVVELEPTAWESLYYGRAHRAKFGEEDSYQVEATEHAKGIDPPTPVGPQPVVDAETEGRENVDKRRRLQTASNNSALDNMYEYKMPADAKTVQKWYEEHAGEGAAFAFFFASTNEGFAPMPSNRVSQAEYLVKCSSKAQYVLKEALRLQAENKKLIVYCDWPSSVYLMKLVFDVLDMHAARISAGQSAKERSAIIGQFNDSRNEDVKILVASSRSAAESFNFQKACHNIIVMDIVNFNTIVQIIGRCYRIGQLHEQFIKILMLNRSYDQSILATYAYAMIAQLAATSGSAVDHITDEKCADALHDDDFKAEMEGRSKFTQRTLIEEAREELYSRIVHAKLRRNFGLRSDRDNAYWANARNPDARFAIREEREFYLGLGGDIAAQVNRFLAAGKDDPAPNTPQSKGVQDHKTRLENTAKREEKQRRRMERQEASRKRKAEAEEDEAARKKRKIEKLKANLRKLEGGNSDPGSSPPPGAGDGGSTTGDASAELTTPTPAGDLSAVEANIRLASALMQDRLSAKGLKALATKAHGIIDKKKHTKKVHFAQVIVDAWEDDFGSIPETALAAGEAVFPTELGALFDAVQKAEKEEQREKK